MRCESYAEEMALVGRNQSGAIFALKNYGWKDEKSLDVKTSITIDDAIRLRYKEQEKS